jgi:hypothetical protein
VVAGCGHGRVFRSRVDGLLNRSAMIGNLEVS